MNNNYKIKYGQNLFHQLPEDLIEYAATTGLKHIEINLSQKELSIKTFTDNRINKLKTLSQLHNVELSFHIPYYVDISDILLPIRNRNINYLLRCMNVASKLQATHVTLHIGKFFWFPVEPLMRKKALNRFIKSMKKVLNLCEDKNVIIALENVVPIPKGSDHYFLGDSVEDFEFIFSSLESKQLKYCLDTGHANMGNGAIEYIGSLHEKLCCLHYHDNSGLNDEHLPIGEGTVKWKELAEKLINVNFQGPLISECRNIDAHDSAALFNKYFE